MEQNFKKTNNATAENQAVADLTGNAVMQSPKEENYSNFAMELKEFFGEEFDVSDKFSQDLLLQYLRVNKEQNAKLTEVLERDPRLAQLLLDVIEGKRNAHTAMARYFGTSLMAFDEQSPEFEEIMLADNERKDEMARLANDRHEYEKNLSESISLIESFCTSKGYDPSDFMDKVWEKLVFPILAGKYSYDVCVALDHAVTYEQDVEDAFIAGDIKGRNTNIRRMKEEYGDGLPKGINSVAPDTEMRPKRNSLIDKALNA